MLTDSFHRFKHAWNQSNTVGCSEHHQTSKEGGMREVVLLKCTVIMICETNTKHSGLGLYKVLRLCLKLCSHSVSVFAWQSMKSMWKHYGKRPCEALMTWYNIVSRWYNCWRNTDINCMKLQVPQPIYLPHNLALTSREQSVQALLSVEIKAINFPPNSTMLKISLWSSWYMKS